MGLVSGGELAARALAEHGVDVVFAIHGGHLNPFLLACADLGVRLVDGRHEGASGHSADGYARATGGLGVVAVTAGAGYANCLPAIVSAHLDRVPLLVVTSSPPLRESELNELQGGIDQVGIVRPVTRWAHRVTSTDRIPDLVGLAVRKALAGPPGPVLLDIPVDVMFSEVEESRIATAGAPAAAPPAPSAEVVAAIVERLEASRRPVVIAGNGIRYSHGLDALVAFADRSGVPVFGQMGTAGLPADHVSNAGGAWNLGMLETELGERPDLVLLVGARLGRFLGGRTGSMVPDDATLVQIDIDPSEIGRVRAVDLPVVADARETLLAVTAGLRDGGAERAGWAKGVVAVNHRRSSFADEPSEVDGRIHPYHGVRAALRALDPSTTVVVDGGEAAGWVWESLAEARPFDVMGFGGYLGILGLSTGLGIGAQVARPGGRVVVFCGDGAAGFHIQELDTMVRHGLPVVTVVVNNALWAQSVRSQNRDYGPRGEVISHLTDTDYDQVATGFGVYGERVTTLSEVAGAMRRALDCGRPALINLSVAYGPEPRTAAGMGRKPSTDEIAVPYYEAIPKGPY
jgi:acetolactate synthase-1/2/3 large subunit